MIRYIFVFLFFTAFLSKLSKYVHNVILKILYVVFDIISEGLYFVFSMILNFVFLNFEPPFPQNHPTLAQNRVSRIPSSYGRRCRNDTFEPTFHLPTAPPFLIKFFTFARAKHLLIILWGKGRRLWTPLIKRRIIIPNGGEENEEEEEEEGPDNTHRRHTKSV